jgi:hypothetical protein
MEKRLLSVRTTTARIAPGEASDGMASGKIATEEWPSLSADQLSASLSGFESPKIMVSAKSRSTIPPAI